jgi:hypothetical protein
MPSVPRLRLSGRITSLGNAPYFNMILEERHILLSLQKKDLKVWEAKLTEGQVRPTFLQWAGPVDGPGGSCREHGQG